MSLNAINFDNIVCGSNIEIKLRDALSYRSERRKNAGEMIKQLTDKHSREGRKKAHTEMCTNEFLPMQKWKWTRHNAFVVAARHNKSRWTFFLSLTRRMSKKGITKCISYELRAVGHVRARYFFNCLATKSCVKLPCNRNFRLTTDDRKPFSEVADKELYAMHDSFCFSSFSTVRIQPATDQHQLTVSSRSTAFLHRFGFSFLSLCCGVVSVRSWNYFLRFL